MKTKVDTSGYPCLCLIGTAGKRSQQRVCVLVALAFIGPRPAGKECCHKDGGKLDNRPGNLYWGTHAQNMRDQADHERCSFARLIKAEAEVIRQLVSTGTNKKSLALRYGVSEQHIRRIARGVVWKCVA